MAYAAGIDIGGTTIKLGLFSDTGVLKDKWEIPTRTEENGKYIFSDIADALLSKLNTMDLGLGDLVGVGVDVPGAVLPDGTVNKCVNLGWGVIRAGDMLSEALGGIKTAVCNDANAAALGEAWRGAGNGADSMCMVTLGTGVGGGIILNGKIVEGAFGACGEVGHIPYNDDETETCGCGKKGCVEQYASGSGIARMCRRKLVADGRDSALRGYDAPDAKIIFDEAKNGDAVALELVDDFSKVLGKTLAIISAVIDPELFVIGGGVSKNGPIVTEGIQKYFRKYAFHASRDARIELATLGNDAGMYGAVHLILGD